MQIDEILTDIATTGELTRVVAELYELLDMYPTGPVRDRLCGAAALADLALVIDLEIHDED